MLRLYGEQILIMVLIIAFAAYIDPYVRAIPVTDIHSVASAFLTASSIVFGFLTLSFSRQMAQLREHQESLSDTGKELLDLYDSVKKNRNLASKKIHWNTRVYKWGFEGFGLETTALKAIHGAYDYLLQNVRFMMDAARAYAFVRNIFVLLFLLVSIFTSVFSHISTESQGFALTISLLALVIATPYSIVAWWEVNSKLREIGDTIFNIRHQIMGGLRDLNAYQASGWRYR